jgi:Tfp pilus assembly protein PilZ
VPAHHSVTLGAPGQRAAARVKNVSEGGLLMTLKKPVAVGSVVSLVIRSADSPRVGLRGEVVRVEPASGRSHPSYDVGVRLLPGPERPAHPILRGAKVPAGP